MDAGYFIRNGIIYGGGIVATSNPNLLDNPWFTVNQRGQSSYNANNTYSVDRWKIVGNAVISVSSSGLTIDNSNESTYWGALRNYFENDVIGMLRGKTVTASVMYSDGSIKSATGVVPTTDPSGNTNIAVVEYLNVQVGFRYFSSGTYKYCMSIDARPSASALTIRAVKLEIGSVSTLHLDTAPNYASELLKCQRYFVRLKTPYNYFVYAVGYVQASKSIRMNLYLPTAMRANPSLTKYGSFRFLYGNEQIDVLDNATFTLNGMSNNILFVAFTSSSNYSASVGTAGQIQVNNDANAYLDFTADL